MDYVPHQSDFKRKVLALKAIPAEFFMAMRCSRAKLCALVELNTSRDSLAALPKSYRFCLTPAPGDILFLPSPWVLSISLVAPSGWWQHCSISFCWCLLLHTSCLAWALSLWHVRTRTIPCEHILSHPCIFSYYLSHSLGGLGLYTFNTNVPSWQLGFSVLLLWIPFITFMSR